MRYVLERHTEHPTHCWRVLDTETEERHGFGLNEADAADLADLYSNWEKPGHRPD